MSIIIIGAGEVGYNVARRLSREREDIVVIDKDEEKINGSQKPLTCRPSTAVAVVCRCCARQG